MQMIVAEQQQKLDQMILSLDSKITIKSRVLIGISFLEIIYEVLRNEHDVVLKMADSGGLLDRLFGTDDMHLLRKCPCPIMLIKPQTPTSYQQILASVDVDDNYPSEELNTRAMLNEQILDLASSLSISASAKLDIVHVWDADGQGLMYADAINTSKERIDIDVEEIKQRHIQNMDDLMGKMRIKLGPNASSFIEPQTHLLKGYPRKKIPEFAAQIKADIIVMGTVARTGIPGFFIGNTAENILNQLDCSVLAVKPPGFVSPVKLND
jgi:nucleotide-binding universal stress UspA family protein